MTYRDDNDALRARLEKVEAELRATEERAGRLVAGGTSGDGHEPIALGRFVALTVVGLPLLGALAVLEQHGLRSAVLHASWALLAVVMLGGWMARRLRRSGSSGNGRPSR